MVIIRQLKLYKTRATRRFNFHVVYDEITGIVITIVKLQRKQKLMKTNQIISRHSNYSENTGKLDNSKRDFMHYYISLNHYFNEINDKSDSLWLKERIRKIVFHVIITISRIKSLYNENGN